MSLAKEEISWVCNTDVEDIQKNLEIALERIDDGSFGMCNICNDLIPEERMIEVPNATKCVKCKEKDNYCANFIILLAIMLHNRYRYKNNFETKYKYIFDDHIRFL